MPAKSKQQQKFMGIVRAIQKGEAPASKFSKKARDVAKKMGEKDVEKYASTKHKGLPKKVKQEMKLHENPAAIAATQAMTKLKLKNPKTGKEVSAASALKNKDNPNHKKAKGIFAKLKDRFTQKKDDKPKPKKQSKADADFYKRQFAGESVKEDLDPYKDFSEPHLKPEYNLNLGAFIDHYQKFIKFMKKHKEVPDKNKREWALAIRNKVGQGMFNGHMSQMTNIMDLLQKGEKFRNLKESVNEYTYGVGDIVKDINPTCPHKGAMGKVKSLNPKSVVFVVMNKGKNYQPGDVLDKTHDQMKKIDESMSQSQAKELLKQLGGNRFRMMVGAKQMSLDKKNGLTMKIGRNAKSISHVRINLKNDLYDIDFIRVRKGIPKIVKQLKGIYADQLRSVFEKYTGLYTSL